MAGQSSIRIYGKVRTSPEYVGRLSETEPDATFSDWLDRATGLAYHEGRERWEGAYTKGAAHALVFRATSRATDALLATVLPSHDSVGRAFPLMAVTTSDVSAPGAATCLPVSAHRCFFSGAGALRDARRAGSLGPAASAAPSLKGPAPGDLAEAARDFRIWQENPVSKLWRALFPRNGAEGGRRALERLRACASAADGADSAYIRLPLGTGAGAAACFWLHALDRSLGGAAQSRISVASWSLEPDGTLLVGLAPEPPLNFWLRLWLDETVDAREGEEPRRESLSPELTRVVGSPVARIADLLDAMGPAPVARSAGAC